MKKIIKVLLLPQGSQEKASSRWHIYNRLGYFQENMIDYKLCKFQKAKLPIFPQIKYYVKFLYYCFWCDLIILQKKFLNSKEKCIVDFFKKKIVFIYDDTLFAKAINDTDENVEIRKEKLNKILSKSKAVIVGNKYLSDYTKQFNDNVHIMAGSIEVNNRLLHKKEKNEIILGWTGYSGNLICFREIEDAFVKIFKKYDNLNLRIVSENTIQFQNPIKSEFLKWNLETEFENLADVDIGLAPMIINEWSKGKIGSRPIVFSALGIPTIATPVGIDQDVFIHKRNILFATTSDDWYECLDRLIRDESLRKEIGRNARKTFEEHYDVKVHVQKLREIFEDVLK